MDAHAQHRLQTSLRALAVDVSAERKARDDAIEAMRLREMEQQLQVEVSGTATGAPASVIVDLDFDVAFTRATGRRMALLTRPHFGYGFEQTRAVGPDGRATDVAVMLAAAVVGWKEQQHDVVGARVAISALAPATVDFRAVAHLTFQGLAAPQDEPDLEG